MIFKTINTLKLELYLKDHLTSDSFNTPDREYIYLKDDKIKLHRFDSVHEDFDFNRFKDSKFRSIKVLF